MSDKEPLLVSFHRAFFMSLFGLIWGVGLFAAGGGVSSSDAYADEGYFQLRAMGLVLIFLSLAGGFYQVMRARAPAKHPRAASLQAAPIKDQAQPFDADAALDRYLEKKADVAVEPELEPDAEERIAAVKGFGRKGAGSSDAG